MISPRPTTLLLLAALVGTGCRDLEKFDTGKGEIYCGTMVAPSEASEGFDFGRSPAAPLYLSMTLRMDSLESIPGKVRSNDADFGPCKPRAMFENAPLRILRKALGDKLSNLNMSDDHEQDLVAYIDSTCSGSMVAIVSLIQNGQVELRLLRPAPDIANAAVADQARFGIFSMTKEALRDSAHCDF